MQPTKAAHTLGPWEVHIAESSRTGFDVQTTGGDTLISWGLKNEANARLIAAAPELLRELEHALADVKARLYMLPIDGEGVSEQKDILSAQIGRYNSAIQKARGGQ